MKKILTYSAIVLGLLTLTGCSDGGGYATGKVVGNGAWRVVGDKGNFDILRDTETGCLYLQSHYSNKNITPYYDENGDIMGCGEEDSSVKY